MVKKEKKFKTTYSVSEDKGWVNGGAKKWVWWIMDISFKSWLKRTPKRMAPVHHYMDNLQTFLKTKHYVDFYIILFPGDKHVDHTNLAEVGKT